uniref:Uncharacterized protein n=1 Tax=Anguilla anguilla TaxID=7936 RepID=A0A0E9WTX5_ANGAN
MLHLHTDQMMLCKCYCECFLSLAQNAQEVDHLVLYILPAVAGMFSPRFALYFVCSNQKKLYHVSYSMFTYCVCHNKP